ncbi:MAG: C40 family peptidase [Gammaproteobacteria bacterium]|nr:C40 family peptidase [Gammaproteobacteria bacterium]MBU6509852.1 C40 family peptidase [Gammaproteobacteria bacterium]MDE1984001.1 C40 family peptidase [Gammaproteobacteria bacterium]MDE2108072.1 C40 family peptidase [Gammaproteobacteria bacterium]MDE2461387.1 C40 family peptidase [Gammaproteobacteria bacterium]
MHRVSSALLMAGLLASGLAACAPWPERPPPANYPSAESLHAQAIVQLASRELGAPYVYGGDTPRGFDCSGLVYYVFRRAGLAVPRTANDQLYAAHPVSLRDLQPGDLVFFEIAGDIQMHVGIYVGNGVFIHAPETGQAVSYARLDDRYWKSRFVGGGRF